MVSLAKMIVKDGEGATKFVEVRVVGADTVEGTARRIAKTVASSQSGQNCNLRGGSELGTDSGCRGQGPA